ncbi:MAG: hypothetical protein ACREA9_02525, partial [Pyrinomonadaceae bacterium]
PGHGGGERWKTSRLPGVLMAFVDWVGVPWAPVWLSQGTNGNPRFDSSGGVTTLNTAAHKAGWIVEVPRTGSLKRIGFRIGSVINNPDNGLRLSFRSIASGVPDTETHFRVMPGPFSSNTYLVSNIVSSDGTDTGSLKSVTRGERIAVTVTVESFVAGDNIGISQGLDATIQGTGSQRGFPYLVQDLGAGWVKNSTTQGEGMLGLGLQYSDDVWYPLIDCNPVTNFPSALVLNSSSNPREAGNAFTVPVPLRVAGFQLVLALANATTSDFDVILYDRTANTILATRSLNGGANELGGDLNTGNLHAWFPSSIELKAAPNVYELGVSGTGTGNVTIYPMAYTSAAVKNAAPLGPEYSRFTAATVGGSRSTTATQQILLVPLFDGIDPIKGGESVGVDSWSPVLFGEEWY